MKIPKKKSVNLHLIDRLPAYKEPLVFPNRENLLKPAYPVGTCSDCGNQTDYSNNICESCARKYTEAFYKLTENVFGIKQIGK